MAGAVDPRPAAAAGDGALAHIFKFLAAMAPAHKIYASHDQGAYVQQFLDVAVKAALNAPR